MPLLYPHVNALSALILRSISLIEVSTMALVMNLVRERDFREFVNAADEVELLRERTLLKSELARFETIRNNTTDLMRERLSVIERALGLAV